MTCLIVGTDRLGAAPRILSEYFGATNITHWSGRKKLPKRLPKGTRLIIVYSGFLNHDHMYKVKRLAKAENVEIKFVHRGLSELVKEGAA